MVLHILSYGDMDDIQARQILSGTTCKVEAAEKGDLGNMRWIYEDIGDTEFYLVEGKLNCTGNESTKF